MGVAPSAQGKRKLESFAATYGKTPVMKCQEPECKLQIRKTKNLTQQHEASHWPLERLGGVCGSFQPERKKTMELAKKRAPASSVGHRGFADCSHGRSSARMQQNSIQIANCN